jgi:hypothetical protein
MCEEGHLESSDRGRLYNLLVLFQPFDGRIRMVWLMGEFEWSGKGREMGLAWAIADILTPVNFVIAIVAALIGYVMFESLRNRF